MVTMKPEYTKNGVPWYPDIGGTVCKTEYNSDEALVVIHFDSGKEVSIPEFVYDMICGGRYCLRMFSPVDWRSCYHAEYLDSPVLEEYTGKKKPPFFLALRFRKCKCAYSPYYKSSYKPDCETYYEWAFDKGSFVFSCASDEGYFSWFSDKYDKYEEYGDEPHSVEHWPIKSLPIEFHWDDLWSPEEVFDSFAYCRGATEARKSRLAFQDEYESAFQEEIYEEIYEEIADSVFVIESRYGWIPDRKGEEPFLDLSELVESILTEAIHCGDSHAPRFLADMISSDYPERAEVLYKLAVHRGDSRAPNNLARLYGSDLISRESEEDGGYVDLESLYELAARHGDAWGMAHLANALFFERDSRLIYGPDDEYEPYYNVVLAEECMAVVLCERSLAKNCSLAARLLAFHINECEFETDSCERRSRELYELAAQLGDKWAPRYIAEHYYENTVENKEKLRKLYAMAAGRGDKDGMIALAISFKDDYPDLAKLLCKIAVRQGVRGMEYWENDGRDYGKTPDYEGLAPLLSDESIAGLRELASKYGFEEKLREKLECLSEVDMYYF